MSFTLGRASLSTSPKTINVDGRRVSFTFDLVATSADHLAALRQQLSGLVGNGDETAVPFTWSEDASLDGFYTDVQVTIPSTPVMLVSYFIQDCTVSMTQVTGFANAYFEVTTTALTRTNSHTITSPSCVQVAGYLGSMDAFDWSGMRTATFTTRTLSDGNAITIGKANPNPDNTFRFSAVPASFYVGACTVEVLDGSTWYTVVGRNVARNAVWRISNGLIRFTSAQGATSGTFEVWDNTAQAWESQNIRHYISTGSINGIGRGNGTTQGFLTIVRNGPETVSVQCVAPVSAGSADSLTVVYTLNRGAAHVAVSWATSGASVSFGPMFTAATGCTASTGGITQTTAVDGNKLLFLVPVASTTDLVNGAVYNTTTSPIGQHAFMVDAGTYTEYYGAVAWRQRVVVK